MAKIPAQILARATIVINGTPFEFKIELGFNYLKYGTVPLGCSRVYQSYCRRENIFSAIQLSSSVHKVMGYSIFLAQDGSGDTCKNVFVFFASLRNGMNV